MGFVLKDSGISIPQLNWFHMSIGWSQKATSLLIQCVIFLNDYNVLWGVTIQGQALATSALIPQKD